MANYKFPVIGFTHGGSYMDADWRSEMGVNALDVGTHHIKDSYVVDWVVNTKTPIYLRNDAAFGYATAKGWYQRWLDSKAKPYICGMTLLDEPSESTSPATRLAEDAKAFRELFPGLPVILNLNCFGSEAYNFVQKTNPDMLSYEIYPVISKEGSCAWAAQWTGPNNEIDFMCNQAKDVFDKGGMKKENNQRIMIIFGTFGFGSCIQKRASVGQVWGYGLFDQMFTVTKNNLGSLLGGAKNYAICTDDESQLGPSGQRDHTPYEHPYVRPYAKYLNNLIYNANLSTPWSVGIAVPPPSSTAVSINSFVATPASIKPGESSKLAWTASNYTSLSISGVGTVTGNSVTVSPSATTTYTLTAIGVGGQVTKDVIVTVSGAGANPTLSLENLSYIYTNTTTKFRLANPGSLTIVKARIWFNIGNNLPYITNRGTITLDADSQGFTYKSDGFVCDGAIFYIELSGGTTKEYNFKQIARPGVVPGSVVGKAGDVVSITLNQSNNETISGATSSNAAVATVTYSGTIATVTFVSSGSANIVLTPSTASLFKDSDLSISVPVTVSSLPVLTSGDTNLVLTASGRCSISSIYSDTGLALLSLKATGSCSLEQSAPPVTLGECNLVLKANGFCLPSTATQTSDSGIVQLFLKAIGLCTISTNIAPPTKVQLFSQTVEVFFD